MKSVEIIWREREDNTILGIMQIPIEADRQL